MKHLLSVAGVAGALALASCSSSAPNAGFDIEAEGPFGAGFRELPLTYTLPDGRGARTIKVSIWYPMPADFYDSPLAEGCANYNILSGDSCGAVQNAPLEPSVYERGYPLVVHSHGHLGWSSQSKHLGEHLARHGYVVVAPNHEGNTILDVNDPDYLALKYERALDIRETLDLIESGLPTDDPLHGAVVTDRVIMSGHSRGTTTVWALLGAQYSRSVVEASCAAGSYDTRGGCPAEVVAMFDTNFGDPRIVAAMQMGGDGGPSDFGGAATFDAIPTPVLAMTGTMDGGRSGIMALDTALTQRPFPWLDWAGACHNFWAHDPFDAVPGTSDPCSQFDHAEGQAAFRTYALAFTRAHLFGDTSALVTGILDGSTVVSSIVTYHP